METKIEYEPYGAEWREEISKVDDLEPLRELFFGTVERLQAESRTAREEALEEAAEPPRMAALLSEWNSKTPSGYCFRKHR